MGEGGNAASYNYKMFKCFTRKFKTSEVGPPPDVEEVFSKFSAGSDHMSPDQFRAFLTDHQDEKPSDFTLSDANRILHEYSIQRSHPKETTKDHHHKKAVVCTMQDIDGSCDTPRVLESKSIKEHAFVRSPYPVVITFEDHLTTKLRVKVAEKIKPHKNINKVVSQGSDRDSSEESERSDNDQDSDGKPEINIKPIQSEAPEYAKLIKIHAGKPQGGLKEALAVGEKVRCLSFSEQKLETAAEDHGTDIVKFTQRNILRVYPKGTRVTSSNYKPHVGWMHGAQVVAFNMQGHDKSLWLMHGMYRANGGCGYLKKPGFLMHKGPHEEVFDPKRTLITTKTLKAKVYMGTGWHLDFSRTHFDSFSPPDFYTKVHIVGVPAECAKHKTRTIEDDWTPVRDEEFTYPLTIPELAILRLEVREYDRFEKDDFSGQTCLPVSELRNGFRSVPLYSKKGEKYSSLRLLMRFQFESNVAPHR